MISLASYQYAIAEAVDKTFTRNVLTTGCSEKQHVQCAVDRPITIDLVQSRLWDAANGEPWDVYMQWLYTGIIPVHLKGLDDHGAKHCQLLMVSHALGERLEDELFQKALQKEIVEDIRISLRAIGYHNIRQVYQQFTNGASTLRKVLVDLYIANADSTKLDL